MKADVDVLIAGAGCAGLSLAVALIDAKFKGRILLCEPRLEYTHDRTWCLWDVAPHPFSACVTHRWSNWRVSTAKESVVRHSSRYSYTRIPAGRFYAAACARIANNSDCELRMNTAVFSATQENPEIVSVATANGEVRTRWFFDSRPIDAALMSVGPASGLLQRFTGWHVRTNKPCFDPATVGLMEFRKSSVRGRTPFLYTLPFSSTEALVEQTYFDFCDLDPAPGPDDLALSLEELTAGSGFEVSYRESGCLPMRASGPVQASTGTRCRAIGIRGGRAKPSSGYAFLRIQQQSRLIASALVAGQPIPSTAEPFFYPLLDRIFLKVLALHPEKMPDLFSQMFRDVAPDVLVRFLSEQAPLSEAVRVALSLPSIPFLVAAFSRGGLFA